MVNSRQKGARGERLWRDFLREHSFSSRRGQQYCGGSDSADVVCGQLNPYFHCEVKFVEKLNIQEAIDQSVKDCPLGKWRYVAHKRKNKDWLVTMPASDWIDLLKEWFQLKNQ